MVRKLSKFPDKSASAWLDAPATALVLDDAAATNGLTPYSSLDLNVDPAVRSGQLGGNERGFGRIGFVTAVIVGASFVVTLRRVSAFRQLLFELAAFASEVEA